MKKVIIVFISCLLIIFGVLTLAWKKYMEDDNMVYFENEMEDIDVSPIVDLMQPQDFTHIKEKEKLISAFDSYELLVTDSTNTKLKLKIDNGIQEMIICKSSEATDIMVNIRICKTAEIAEKWYGLEIKYAKDNVEMSNEKNNQWFINKKNYIEDQTVVTKVGFQKSNVVILISESANNSNTNISHIISVLSEILLVEFSRVG